MDFLEILFLLLFILLPLLQGLLDQKKKPRRPLPPPGEAPEGEREPTALETMRIPPFPAPRPEAEGGWSDGWGGWPGEPLPAEVEGAEEEILEDAEAEEVAEETRVASQVVSLEPLKVDYQEQHRRFRERFVSPLAAPAARPGAASLLSAHLAGAELRRAIVLSEVLGPPVSMREEGHR